MKGKPRLPTFLGSEMLVTKSKHYLYFCCVKALFIRFGIPLDSCIVGLEEFEDETAFI